MTDKEIQASDEEMEQFNVSQNEKCVSAEEVKMIKAELNQLAAKDKYSNIYECTLRLINLYEAIILGNQMEIAELKKNALVWHDYETEKPQKEGECILIIERELCGQKRQVKCFHCAEKTNMGFDFITNHKILKWAELP